MAPASSLCKGVYSVHYIKKRFRKAAPKTKPVNCGDCKWRFGDIKEKCIACGRASAFVSFERREEKIDGVYSKVPSK